MCKVESNEHRCKEKRNECRCEEESNEYKYLLWVVSAVLCVDVKVFTLNKTNSKTLNIKIFVLTNKKV